MAQITNGSLLSNLRIEAGLQTQAPISALSESVQPTLETNTQLLRQINVVRANVATNSTSSTIYTVPSSGKFFLYLATLSLIKDVTSTSTSSAIQITPKGGAQVNLVAIASITLTVQSADKEIYCAHGIELEPGSTVNVTNSTNVANIKSSGCIAGHLTNG